MTRLVMTCCLGLTLALLAYAPKAAAGIVIIAHPKNGEKAVSIGWVRDVFLGHVREFPTGHRATPIDQSDDQPVWTEFAEKVLDKPPKKLKAYWSVKVFSGRGQPPPAKGDDEDVIAWVAEHPEAVGYLSAPPSGSSVKVLLIVP